MNKKEVIEKIKKCLALSKSANQHEAATALRQAQALMEKFNIDVDDAELLGIQEAIIIGSGSRKPTIYESRLATAIARMMDCEVLLTQKIEFNHEKFSFKKINHWKFIGFDPAPEIATYAFDVLFRQLKKARKEFIDTSLNRVKITSNKTKRADLFCEGWVIEAIKQISNISPNKDKIKQIDAYISKKHEVTTFAPVDRNEKTNMNSDRNQNDYGNGLKAGRNAQLNKAMNGGQEFEKLGANS
ncbi:hypothetical protein J537_2336 [Acinetobacter baumannii 1437282]|uniref:DUF2786 domain-containing protein n=1 Tax=Acinetobacter dispersus TaxID=70348 RepID=UPI0004465AD5|nr:DUF2786 domain-containing protein [Acinetobacter dispersus]EXB26057.1 hypothetical protein J537_2336 [Acinetobacter baumannii 1437282]QHH96721.1 DUF2786 domain-containing protein [Acinetobacter dispersus]